MLQSSRLKINYPDPLRTDSADVPRDFGSIIAWLDGNAMGYGQGTLAARPTSTGGSPGVQGRIYVATDQTPHQIFYDFGTGWDAVGAITPSTINQQGTLTLRPSAGSVPAGTKYWANDQIVEYISDGSTWNRVGIPAGHTTDWFNDTVIPAGWVAYDGSNLASATGIYADLYAHLGSTLVTPDTRGRVTVSRGTHADVNHALNNDGVAAGSRRPRHKHTVNDPGHNHGGATGVASTTVDSTPGSSYPFGSGVGVSDLSNAHTHSIATGATGVTIGPQTGSEPVDGPAFIAAVKIAKL